MPAVTYLSDHEVARFSSVADDAECNELLQEFRQATGENWLIEVNRGTMRRSLLQHLLHRPERIVALYTLYADCHGEWQVMNLITPQGGSNFHTWEHSREAVMNYMMGYIGGLGRRVAA